MNLDQKAVREYKKSIKHDGKYMDVILKIYDEPIVKTASIQLHTRFAIMDGDIEWGHGMFPEPIPEDKVAKELDAICAELDKYKNK